MTKIKAAVCWILMVAGIVVGTYYACLNNPDKEAVGWVISGASTLVFVFFLIAATEIKAYIRGRHE